MEVGIEHCVRLLMPRALAMLRKVEASYGRIMQERRQNVRVRPAPDYDVRIDYAAGLVKVQCSVMDVAVGGVGLVVDELFADVKSGSQLRLGVELPDYPRFETQGALRYTQGKAGGRCGIHLNAMTEEQQAALSKAVSELLERGHSV
jgi:hypothetical protein